MKTEMCGGGSLGWKPGEFTDDTQTSLLVMHIAGNEHNSDLDVGLLTSSTT